MVTTYTESMGRVGDNRRQTTYAWYAQDTWKVRPGVTFDAGVRMYKSDLPRHISDESSVFSFEVWGPLDLDVSFVWDRIENPADDPDGETPKSDDFQLTVGVSLEL